MMASLETEPVEQQQTEEPVPGAEAFNPFTDADLQKILYEEKSNSEAEGWKFASRSQYTEIWRKQEPNQSVHLIKGFLHFPGIPPSDVVELINNVELRKRWDRQFPVIDVLEQHDDYRVVYWLTKMPPAVADRDIVQYIGQKTDAETNTTYILYRNAVHPDRPERRGIVRAETILSGTIVRPDEDDRNSTRMSILLQTDVKGWIPHFIVNVFAARAPRSWQQTLYDFHTNVYSKEMQKSEPQQTTGTTEEPPSSSQQPTEEQPAADQQPSGKEPTAGQPEDEQQPSGEEPTAGQPEDDQQPSGEEPTAGQPEDDQQPSGDDTAAEPTERGEQ